MSTITLPNIRVGSDLQVRARLKDGGVAIDWSTLQNIKACIYSDAQRALAGRCAFSIDEEDSTLLVCTYAANKPQYLGVNRIVISAKYMGETKTYDKPAFSFVRWTADQEGEEITIDDPDVDVEIDVEDISSSILQEAVDAAFTAADRANDAAAAAEHMVDIHTGPEGKSAYEVAVEEGYVGTEEEWLASLVGPQGAQGIQGETGEAAGFGTVSVSLQEDGGQPSATVAASGTDTAKNFAFTFNNLKGDKGDKGDQGNSGYTGAAGELEVVNNLTDGGAAKALSAEMGKTLEGEVSQLEAEVDGKVDYKIVIGVNKFDKTSTAIIKAYCGTNNYSYNDSYRTTHPIYVESGKTYKFHTQGSMNTQRIAKCTSDGTFISSFQVVGSDGFITFTADETGYIRANIGAANQMDAYMFCLSSEYPSTYAPYEETKVVGDEYGFGTKQVGEVETIVYNEVKDSLPFNMLIANEGWAETNGLYYTGGTHKVISLGGQRKQITIRANSSKNTFFFVLKTYTKPTVFGSASPSPDYATGETGRHTVSSNTEIVYPLPSDARYIVFGYTKNSVDYSPVKIIADGIDFINDARIALGPVSETQEKAINENLLPLFCPAPQLPANDSANSDFNCETLTAAQLQAAFDSLVDKLPTYSSRYGIIGKDCTGDNDLKSYVFTRRNRYAFKAENALYAWKDSGNNIVYIDSVSPVVGSNIYSDANRTVLGIVSAYAYVSGVATMTDGNNSTYTREGSSDIPVDVVFSKTLTNIESGFAAYNSDDSSAGNATSSDGINYSLSGKTYTRFSGFDYHTDIKFTIVLVGNVHGPQSDPLEPSVTMYRLALDLCTGAGIKTNRFINYLKKNARIVMFPVANPSGILKWVNNHQNGRENANNVNINRNFDTPGWAVYSGTDKGTYPGDQAETQYIMNLIALISPNAAYDCHCYAYWNAAGSSTDSASAYGLVSTAEKRDELTEVYWDSFNIKTWQFGYGDPATGCQLGSYLKKLNIPGSTIEMWAGEATASSSDYYNGHQHTTLVMEYCYTMLLNSIKSVWEIVDTSKDFSVMGIQ